MFSMRISKLSTFSTVCGGIAGIEAGARLGQRAGGTSVGEDGAVDIATHEKCAVVTT